MSNGSSRWMVSAVSALVLATAAGVPDRVQAQQASTPYGGTARPMPGRFEAEDFDNGGNGVAYVDRSPGNAGDVYRRNESVDLVASGDSAGGNYDVNYFQTGESLTYTVEAESTTRYEFELRVASAFDGSAFRLQVDGQDIGGPVTVPNTGAWNSYAWVKAPAVQVAAGTHRLTVVAANQYFNLNSIRSTGAPVATPYYGTPFAVPGSFEAEDFDRGGEGLAYHDLRGGNSGGQYRPNEDVDIVANAAGGGFDVNFFETGEWLQYTVDVAEDGNYDVVLNLASGFDNSAFRIEVDGVDVSGAVSVPGTGGWNSYDEIRANGIAMTKGRHAVRVVAAAQYFNLDRVTIEASDAGQPAPEPYTGTPAAVPGYFEAEHYDLGGEGVAYHDLSAGNTGNAFRAGEDVDIAPTGDPAGGGYDVNYFETGEWLSYTIDVAETGDYDIALRAASAFADSAFHVEIDGRDVTGSVAVPNTGSWTTFAWVTKSGVNLSAGRHVLTVVADRQYFNLNSVQVSDAGAPPPDNGARLLFSSGFEGGTSLVPPTDCWGTGCWQDIIGLDNVSNFSWPSTLWSGTSRFLMLTDPVWMTPSTLGNYMFNRIENATGPRGGSTKVLYQEISRNVNGTEPMGTSPAQNELQFLPTTEPGDMYVSFWVKLQPDLVEKMRNLPAGPGINNGGTWRAFFALKTGSQKPDGGPANDGDYRIETYIMTYGNTQPYWVILGDNNAGGGAPRVNSWSAENRQVPVPVGKWFKFEIFWHRSSGNDGRVWMAVDGQVLADRWGPNMGAWNMPINRIMAPMLYSGSRMPIYQWIDDVEIWDGFPPQGNNPPYAAH